LIDFPSGKEAMRFAHPQVHQAALSPDGRHLATSCFNHELRLWDARSGRELRRLPDAGWRSGYSRDFVFTSDSRRLCTWEADCRLLVWDVQTGRLLAEHCPRPDGFPKANAEDDGSRRRRRDLLETLLPSRHGAAFSADGSRLIWVFNKLRTYDTMTGKLLRTYATELDPNHHGPRLRNDGEVLLTGGGD